MNDISKTKRKRSQIEVTILPVLAATLLSGCTTLTHQVVSQYKAATLALANERSVHARQDAKASALARQAQIALQQPSGIPTATQDLATIQTILSPNGQPMALAEKQTDTALSKLDHASVKAAKLAQQEQSDSAFFGIPGLLHHGLQLLSSTVYFVIAAIAFIALIYIASFFFPQLGPILSLVESLIISGISKLSQLRR